jgi:hypothetical protein
MTKKPDSKERRKHKRVKTHDNLYVLSDFYDGETGQIIDISEEGLAFRYIPDKNWSEDLKKVDIMSTDNFFYLKDLSVKVVSESDDINENPIYVLPTKRCSVKFVNLPESQKSQLKYFLETQILKTEYLKH